MHGFSEQVSLFVIKTMTTNTLMHCTFEALQLEQVNPLYPELGDSRLAFAAFCKRQSSVPKQSTKTQAVGSMQNHYCQNITLSHIINDESQTNGTSWHALKLKTAMMTSNTE